MKRKLHFVVYFWACLCLICACSDSEFDKDYENYQKVLVEKHEAIEKFLNEYKSGVNSQNSFSVYLNGEFLTFSYTLKIENNVVYIGNYLLDLKDFIGADQSRVAIYFWK